MKRTTLTILLLAVSTALLFALSMTTGAVNIPASDVLGIMLGRGTSNHTWHFIVTETRLPSAVTAMMAGSSLAVSGLLLQTAFRNPLAGPGIFGISSGASVGVALVMLALGGELSAGAFSVGGFMAVLAGAFVGAMAVTAVIFAFSTMVRSSVVLLIMTCRRSKTASAKRSKSVGDVMLWFMAPSTARHSRSTSALEACFSLPSMFMHVAEKRFTIRLLSVVSRSSFDSCQSRKGLFHDRDGQRLSGI